VRDTLCGCLGARDQPSVGLQLVTKTDDDRLKLIREASLASARRAVREGFTYRLTPRSNNTCPGCPRGSDAHLDNLPPARVWVLYRSRTGAGACCRGR